MSYAHLTAKTAEKLALSDKERIDHIKKSRWIGYSRAQSILDKLEDLLEHPTQPRMPNMLLVGETNNGKTMLIERFREKHLAHENDDRSGVVIPILFIQAPPGPDERGLYNAIMSRLFERIRMSESTDQKRDRVVAILKRSDLGMIVIDEIHHLLAGPFLKQRNFLNVLKYLGNELCVPIVGVGTADALKAVQIDPQLENRFMPEVLPRWELNAEFARLLVSFESLLPLKEPSRLADRDMASRILAMTGGTIGEMSNLLNEAATYAIRKKTERVDAEALARCGYKSPSDRKSAASRM
jgi:hypothetical protein